MIKIPLSFMPVLAALVLGHLPPASAEAATHAMAMHGAPALPPDFGHFGYVNPEAPRGGDVSISVVGSFDSVNPLIIRGVAAAGVRRLVYESLMTRSQDEPFSLYGLLAQSVDLPDDRRSVTFTLHPKAAFSDGTPVSVDDVIFSLETLRDEGRPNHRFYYSQVVKIERPGPRSVRFLFDGNDREIPLIMGLMPIVSQKYFEANPFDETSLNPPLGSGPYTVASVEPGQRIVYERNPAYWGRDLPPNRGRFNFDRIIYDYYRDANSAHQAFTAGEVQFRTESDPVRWASGYDVPAVAEGRINLLNFETGTPSGMRGMVFNERRAPFNDVRVRRALILLFDADWVNRNLYHGLYARTQSYFDGSALSSRGRAPDSREKSLLSAWPGAVTPEILAEGYAAPIGTGDGGDGGGNRRNRRQAMELLQEAGFVLLDGHVSDAQGEPLEIEMLVAGKDDERLALTYAAQLRRAGITMTVRQVDATQYQQRRQEFDYDMIFNFWYASLSPGNEQRFYWGSEAAEAAGSRNYMGVQDPAVDAMIDALLAARDGESFASAVRALDRVLLSGFHVVPLFHLPEQWVAAWEGLNWPTTTPLYGYHLDAWWRSP